MTVESYVMVRAGRNENGDYGPREDDLGPYATAGGEDVTGKASDRQDADFIQFLESGPPLVIWRLRMSNQDALTMSTDPKLWMIISQQYTIDEDGNRVIIQDNKDAVYRAQERQTLINQLGNITEFDAATIANWWTPDKTRLDVAVKLRKYLRSLDPND